MCAHNLDTSGGPLQHSGATTGNADTSDGEDEDSDAADGDSADEEDNDVDSGNDSGDEDTDSYSGKDSDVDGEEDDLASRVTGGKRPDGKGAASLPISCKLVSYLCCGS